jgi:acyl-CoA oxidase
MQPWRCYLQTELAHGSNLTALETTATYIPETREFEINSPTFTSSKWWIGAAGKYATHGVLQAQLILPGGKNMGPHLFFVQLRSLGTLSAMILSMLALMDASDDHTVMPGIMLGDIGMYVVFYSRVVAERLYRYQSLGSMVNNG